MKHTALFEVPYEPIEFEVGTRKTSKEALEDLIQEWHKKGGLLTFSADKKEQLKSYKEIELSEETYQFIQMTANIEQNMYGNKTYVINNIKFKIVSE